MRLKTILSCTPSSSSSAKNMYIVYTVSLYIMYANFVVNGVSQLQKRFQN